VVGCRHKAVVCGGTRRGDGVVWAHEAKIHGHQCTSPATLTTPVIWAHENKIHGHQCASPATLTTFVICTAWTGFSSWNAVTHKPKVCECLTHLACSKCRTWFMFSSLLCLVCYSCIARLRIVMKKHGWRLEFTCGMRHRPSLKLQSQYGTAAILTYMGVFTCNTTQMMLVLSGLCLWGMASHVSNGIRDEEG